MPLYEYLCQDCGHRCEILQRLDEPAATECPQCQGRLRKLLSAPAFQFKGSGWYLTDYARKGGGESASQEKASSGEPGGTEKSESGPQKPESGTKNAGSPGAEKAPSAPAAGKPASPSAD